MESMLRLSRSGPIVPAIDLGPSFLLTCICKRFRRRSTLLARSNGRMRLEGSRGKRMKWVVSWTVIILIIIMKLMLMWIVLNEEGRVM